MVAVTHVDYQGYNVTITEEGGRFVPRVSRAGGMVAHDGRTSEAWASASCGSIDRALQTAKTAIDTGRVK